MMTKQEKQAEMNSLLSILHWLKNGGNSYSFVGRERLAADPIDVTYAIQQIEDEIALVMNANVD